MTTDVESLGVLIFPLPVTNVHSPYPATGSFPCKIIDPPQIVSSSPALACDGGVSTVIVTVSVFIPQELLTSHCKIFFPILKSNIKS